jgi:putative ABC transport system substrate-binding protein
MGFLMRCAVIFFVSVLCLLGGPAPAGAYNPVILVIKSKEIPQYTTALVGFTKALKSKNIIPRIIEYDLVNAETIGGILKTVRKEKPELVFTLGTIATCFAKNEIKDRPIIFAMVLDPASSNLSASNGNIAGVALDIPVRIQFAHLEALSPPPRRIGVLYNPAETGGVITEAVEVARDLQVELIAKPVYNGSEVPAALEDLSRNGIDCLWSVSDSTVFNSFRSVQYIILYALHRRIPFMGISSSFVRSGALLALSCDPEDNGAQAGELAARVLCGENVAKLGIEIPRKPFFSFNRPVAQQIGVSLSPDIRPDETIDKQPESIHP